MNKDQFGINMKKYCKEHEQAMNQLLSDKSVSEDVLKIHREKIAIVQHERLVNPSRVLLLSLFLLREHTAKVV